MAGKKADVKADVKNAKGAKGAQAKPAAVTAIIKKPSMSGRVVELALKGRSNKEITEVLRKEFGLPDNHGHYAAWYRQAYVRKLKASMADQSVKERKATEQVIANLKATAAPKQKQQAVAASA